MSDNDRDTSDPHAVRQQRMKQLMESLASARQQRMAAAAAAASTNKGGERSPTPHAPPVNARSAGGPRVASRVLARAEPDGTTMALSPALREAAGDAYEPVCTPTTVEARSGLSSEQAASPRAASDNIAEPSSATPSTRGVSAPAASSTPALDHALAAARARAAKRMHAPTESVAPPPPARLRATAVRRPALAVSACPPKPRRLTGLRLVAAAVPAAAAAPPPPTVSDLPLSGGTSTEPEPRAGPAPSGDLAPPPAAPPPALAPPAQAVPGAETGAAPMDVS